MSPSAKFYAEPVTRGVELGAKLINQNGGVLGKKIELIIEDDQNKPDISAAKARKLVDDGVVAIISNTGSPATRTGPDRIARDQDPTSDASQQRRHADHATR